MTSTPYSIAVLAGDGIGPEVMRASLRVLKALQPIIARTFDCTDHPAGAQHYLDAGDALPATTLDACRRSHAILFGAMGLPHVRKPDGTEIIPQLDIRFALDLYAGVRPIRTFPGLPGPLASPKASQIDLVLVRENTEGLFYARGRGVLERAAPGDGADGAKAGEAGAGQGDGRDNAADITAALDTMKITRAGTQRICDFALRLARQRREQGRAGHVTSVDKANVFTSMAFWRQVFEERAKWYPDITTDSAYVDAMALNLVMKPWTYDVLVTENMFGDILSDLIASLVGGMGMAPSGDIGDDYGLFQPAHGTAPDIAGKGIANPTAMILSVAMMLEWLAQRHGDAALADGAARIDRAVQSAFESGDVLPGEFGGTSSTDQIAHAVIAKL